MNKLDEQLSVIYQTSENLGWEDYLEVIKTDSKNIDEYVIEDIESELEDYSEILIESNLLNLSSESGLIYIDIHTQVIDELDNKSNDKNTQALIDLRFAIQQYCEMLIVITPFSSSDWPEANKNGHIVGQWLQEEGNLKCPMIIKPLHQNITEIKDKFKFVLLVKDENA